MSDFRTVMNFLLWATLIGLPSFDAFAFKLHVRDDDPGFMHQVSTAIVPQKTINFNGMHWSTREHEGVTWGISLEGMVGECLANQPLNPDRITGAPSANGKISGEPSVPLTAIGSDAILGETIIYNQRWVDIGDQALSYTRHCGDFGDSSWAMVFDQPRTALSLELIFHFIRTAGKYDMTVGDRYHLEFWGTDGSLVGHQDIVDSDHRDWRNSDDNRIQRFSWVSDVPVAGFSAWPENGPGAAFTTIVLGTIDDTAQPPLSLEERVEILEHRVDAIEAR